MNKYLFKTHFRDGGRTEGGKGGKYINTNTVQKDKAISLVVFILAHSDVQSIVTTERKEKAMNKNNSSSPVN